VEWSRGVQSVRGLESSNGALVSLRGLEPGASMTLRLGTGGHGVFIRPETGGQIATIAIPAGMSTIPIPAHEPDLIFDVHFRKQGGR
jgi:hypothetical protein